MRAYYISSVIFILGITYAISHDLSSNELKYNDVDVKNILNFALDHITVAPERETSETMTEARGQDSELSQGRTFAVKRLQFMLLPLMYKMGVMTTLLVMLVVLSLKSLLIGLVLLVIKISSFVGKFYHHYPHIEPVSEHWAPPSHSWPQPQPVHVHVHRDDLHDPHDPHDPHDHSYQYDRNGQAPHVQNQVYSGWVDQSLTSSSPYDKQYLMDRQGQYVVKG